MFSHHVYITTGFLQNQGSPSGLLHLWHETFVDIKSEEVNVRYAPWDNDWDAEAEFVYRFSSKSRPPVIVMVAYSWGAGYGFVQFAKRLAERGLKIAKAVLLDPVYRHYYWLGQWRAFVPWIPITVPRSVEEVWSFTQATDCPRGHVLRAADPKATIIHPPVQVMARHSTMDEHRDGLNHARNVISELLACQ